MVNKYSSRSYTFENGRWLLLVTLDFLSLNDKRRFIRLLTKRDGYIYERKLRAYVRYEHGLIHDYVTITKIK